MNQSNMLAIREPCGAMRIRPIWPYSHLADYQSILLKLGKD